MQINKSAYLFLCAVNNKDVHLMYKNTDLLITELLLVIFIHY